MGRIAEFIGPILMLVMIVAIMRGSVAPRHYFEREVERNKKLKAEYDAMIAAAGGTGPAYMPPTRTPKVPEEPQSMWMQMAHRLQAWLDKLRIEKDSDDVRKKLEAMQADLAHDSDQQESSAKRGGRVPTRRFRRSR